MAPLMRSVLSALLKNNQSLDTLGLGLNPILAEAILDQRNQHIVDTLLVSDQKKIILVYGALHFEGIYALLQAHDPRWNILSIEPMYPYSSPLVKI